MSRTDFGIALRNYAGVPVVELVGEIDENTVSSLTEIIDKLVQAGHYNIMINLKRAILTNPNILKSLEKAAMAIQSHYGHLNIIGEVKQLGNMQVGGKLSKAIRLCTSEGQALMKLRKLPAAAVGGVTSMAARLAEN